MKECRKCARWFGSQRSLEQHLHSPAHRVSCKRYWKDLCWQNALQRHLQSSLHQHNCRYCNKSVKSANGLEQHLNSAIHVHKCSDCDQAFRSSQALEQHLQSPTHRIECPLVTRVALRHFSHWSAVEGWANSERSLTPVCLNCQSVIAWPHQHVRH